MRERILSEMSLEEKLNILSDAAKYDVSCTSSGRHRDGELPKRRDLSQFFGRWKMYFSAQDPVYK